MAKKKSKPKSSLLGRWQITSMSEWDEDYLNEEVQAFIEFEAGRRGEVQFGLVHGFIDYRDVVRGGKPAVEFSWDGNDEMDPAQGRGWGCPGWGPAEGDDLLSPGRRVRVRGGPGSRGGMNVADEEKLKLGKGAAFVKGRIKALPPSDEVWEADFQALPRPIDQSGTHYLGMVITEGDGSLLADLPIAGRPSVNDLATVLAHAMRRPLDENARRPRLVRLRGHHQWRELFPHLEEVGARVEVLAGQDLPGIMKAYGRHLRQLQEEHRVGMLQPTSQQEQVGAMFPSIAWYVRRHGTIEIGQDEMIGFVVQANGDGGTAVEDDRPKTLAEAMAVLEAGLTRWFEEQGLGLV